MALADSLAPSIVEVGKVKIGMLGPPRSTQDGQRTWRPPVKLDHFLVTTLYRDDAGQLLPDQVLMDSLAPFADKKDGKLRSIPIMFPSNDLDDIMQSTHVWYVGKKLGARRDGKKVTFFFDPSTGEPLKEPRTGAWDDQFFASTDPCDRAKKRKLFKRFTTLNVMIAAGMARWGGLYKFRSSGEISARQLYGSLCMLHKMAAGVLRGPIFRLVVRPLLVSPEGVTTTVQVVHVEYVSNDAKELLRHAQEQAALEAATATAIAEADRQYKCLLAAAVDEPPDDDEDLDPLVFNQTLKPGTKVEGGTIGEDPKIAEKQGAAIETIEKGLNAAKDDSEAAAFWMSEKVQGSEQVRGLLEVLDEEQKKAAIAMKDKRKAELAAAAKPELPKSAEDLATLFAEVERLAVQVGGSWEAIRKEYAEPIGFTGTRVKDLAPEQAVKLRDQLKLDLAAKEQSKGAAA